MKNSIIEELLSGKFQAMWERASRSPEAEEARAEADKYANEIETLLRKDHVELWDNYVLAEGGVSDTEKRRAFRMGARFGLFLALELLGDEE